jgi:2Fe-2S ferredoxin
MPRIDVLPHPEICPEGKSFEAEEGMSICDNLLDHEIEIEHACEKVLRLHDVSRDRARGFDVAAASSEDEDDLLDRAWGLTPLSRLSCQAIVADADLKIEIPRYTINYAKENR